MDATQAVGKTKLVLDGVDTLSIAPHKFYGLNGSGLLIKKKDLVIEPQIHGGLSTTLFRSGTPALGLAVSIETALRLALERQEERARYVGELNVYLRRALAAYPAVRINSPDNAVPHILNLSVKGVKGTDFQQALARRDVCVSVKGGKDSMLMAKLMQELHRHSDVIETTVMGMFYGSQLQAMPPKLHSSNFEGMELIRPMYCIHEDHIIAWRRYNELEFIQCACRFTENCTICDNGGGGSKRQEIKTLIRRLKRDNPNIEKSIFNAIHAVCLDTFPGYKSGGEEHSFLENYDLQRNT